MGYNGITNIHIYRPKFELNNMDVMPKIIVPDIKNRPIPLKEPQRSPLKQIFRAPKTIMIKVNLISTGNFLVRIKLGPCLINTNKTGRMQAKEMIPLAHKFGQFCMA